MTDIWEYELRLWLDSAQAYDELMAPQCVMAFGPMGIMLRNDIVASLRQAPRWVAVTMRDKVEICHGPGTVVLAYRACGERDSGVTYEALCTSTYIRENEVWRIAQHQQTPVEADV